MEDERGVLRGQRWQVLRVESHSDGIVNSLLRDVMTKIFLSAPTSFSGVMNVLQFHYIRVMGTVDVAHYTGDSSLGGLTMWTQKTTIFSLFPEKGIVCLLSLRFHELGITANRRVTYQAFRD